VVGKNRVKIECDNGQIVSLPLSANDIRFAEFCDFIELENQSLNKNADEKDVKDFTSIPLQLIVEALEFVVDGDLSVLTENDILYCYSHILKLVSDYKSTHDKGTDYVVLIDGIEYVITVEQFNYMLNESLSVVETVEFLEVDRWVHNAMQTAKELSNLEFNLGLSQLAILLRKRGEQLPISKSKRDAFIEQRKLIFQELPLSTVLDIRAFFLSIIAGLSMTSVIPIFSKVSKTQTLVAESRA
jgi:hypothetical protein